jgi:peroxiredoxin Q/BCP
MAGHALAGAMPMPARKTARGPTGTPARPAKRAPARTVPRAKAASPADEPAVGARAPDVALWDHDGKPFHLSDFRGRNVVLYFYPKDMTTGCTVEACEFNDAFPRYEQLEAVVLGVSPDDAASHRKFRAKHDLRFPLAYDPSLKALEAFGVWQEKRMYGRTYMGVVRSTFLIDREGVVRGAWRRVKPEGHAAEVLAALRAMG